MSLVRPMKRGLKAWLCSTSGDCFFSLGFGLVAVAEDCWLLITEEDNSLLELKSAIGLLFLALHTAWFSLNIVVYQLLVVKNMKKTKLPTLERLLKCPNPAVPSFGNPWII